MIDIRGRIDIRMIIIHEGIMTITGFHREEKTDTISELQVIRTIITENRIRFQGGMTITIHALVVTMIEITTIKIAIIVTIILEIVMMDTMGPFKIDILEMIEVA